MTETSTSHFRHMDCLQKQHMPLSSIHKAGFTMSPRSVDVHSSALIVTFFSLLSLDDVGVHPELASEMAATHNQQTPSYATAIVTYPLTNFPIYNHSLNPEADIQGQKPQFQGLTVSLPQETNTRAAHLRTILRFGSHHVGSIGECSWCAMRLDDWR